MNEPQPLTDEQWCDFHAWARLSDRCIATCGDDEITLGMLVATIDRQQRELEAARECVELFRAIAAISVAGNLTSVHAALAAYDAAKKENADA
jgi:hypothetical protein